jgi:hypothetical protein
MFDQQHPSTVGLLFDRAPNRGGWPAIDAMFGDQFFTLDGSPLRRGVPFTPDQRQERMPVLLDNRRQLCSDLIPDTSWGSSLANLLVASSWNALRTPLIQNNHEACEICGGRGSSLDVHEIWEYFLPQDWQHELSSLPDDQMIFGVQKLTALWPVCRECHECFHLGLANVRGRIQIVLRRLAAINLWSADTVNRYVDVIHDRFDFHNKFLWALDLSLVAEIFSDALVVKKSWQPIPDHPHVLVAPPPRLVDGSEADNRVTILCNVAWRFHTDPACEPLPLSALYG